MSTGLDHGHLAGNLKSDMRKDLCLHCPDAELPHVDGLLNGRGLDLNRPQRALVADGTTRQHRSDDDGQW